MRFLKTATLVLFIQCFGIVSFSGSASCLPLLTEDSYTARSGSASFMREIIRHPFPDESTKHSRVMAVLPELEKHRRAAGDARIINWDLIRMNGLVFKESKGEAQIDDLPRRIEEVLIKLTDASGNDAGGIYLTVVGNAVLAGDWSDRFGANRVFLFDGPSLIRSIPLTDFILDGIGQTSVILRRTNFASEYQRWMNHDVAGLIETGRKTGGFAVNVLYFHLGDIVTYRAPGADREVRIVIPTEVLRDLNSKGLIRMGYIGTGGPDWMLFETVVLQDGWSTIINYVDRVLAPDNL